MRTGGMYFVVYQISATSSSGVDNWYPYIQTRNAGTGAVTNVGYGGQYQVSSQEETFSLSALVNIPNADTALLMGYSGASNITLRGTGLSVTAMHIMRLGDSI